MSGVKINFFKISPKILSFLIKNCIVLYGNTFTIFLEILLTDKPTNHGENIMPLAMDEKR